MVNDNILALIERTPDAIMRQVAERVRMRRLELNWTQNLLAAKAGLPLATYRRFESKGEISFRALIMIAIALRAEDDIEQLFSTKNYQSIDELIDGKQNSNRKRATKNE